MARVLGNRRTFSIPILCCRQDRPCFTVSDQHGYHALSVFEHHAAHATCFAAHGADIFLVKTDSLACVRKQHHIALPIGNGHPNEMISLIQTHRDNAGLARVGKTGQRRLLDRASGSGHKDEMLLVKLFHRQDGRNFFIFFKREQINNRLAARCARAFWRLINLQPIHAATAGKTQNVIMGIGDKQAIHKIIVLDSSRLLTPPAALLRPVIRQRLTLEIARMR